MFSVPAASSGEVQAHSLLGSPAPNTENRRWSRTFISFLLSYYLGGVRLGFNWEEFGERIVEKVVDALDHYCMVYHPEDPLSCYKAYISYPLLDLADEFVLFSDITLEELELLRRMPGDVYERYDRLLHDVLRDIVEYMEAEEGRSRELRKRKTVQRL
jgi:hypothetical protein